MTKKIALALVCFVASVGCHNTARGVKDDTARALHKTGEKLEKAGSKVDRK